jgi:phospholipid/cholesterol/gamma-HCH transport system ATP-binding protein
MLVDKQVVVGTLREVLANPHPQIQQYFGGERARVLLRGD